VGLATTISYLIGIVADTVELFNVLWHPAFLAVSSYGATIRRAGTRFVGTVIGCLLAIVATIAVMPNLSELPALALVLFAVTVPSAYVALGGPRFSYVGVQIVVAFAIVALAEQAHADVQSPLWRAYGALLRSEEHTSELQSRFDLVCRLLLEKKKPRTPAARRPSSCSRITAFGPSTRRSS